MRTWLSAALLAALALPASAMAAQPATPAGDTLDHLERELAAARDTDLYLVLFRDGTRLDVRARGRTLHSVELAATSILEYDPVRSRAAGVQVPAEWEVAEDVSASHRKLIAPPDLKPFPEDEEEMDPTAAAPEVLPDPPSAYSVRLEGGWRLDVVQEPPTRSWGSRLAQALSDGWRRLRGGAVERPPRLVLTVEAEDGRRLHQLFRKGRRILLEPRDRPPADNPDSVAADRQG